MKPVWLRLPTLSRRYLYHLTSETKRSSILANGINPGYWASEAGVRYFLRLPLHDDPLIFRVPLHRFAVDLLEPDLHGRLDPPLINGTIDQIETEWFFHSQRTWADSLRLMGSVYYRGMVAVTGRARASASL